MSPCLVFYGFKPRSDADTHHRHRSDPSGPCDLRLADDEICKEPPRPEIPESDTEHDGLLEARSSRIPDSEIQLVLEPTSSGAARSPREGTGDRTR